MFLLILFALAMAASNSTFYTWDVIDADTLESLNKTLMYRWSEEYGINQTTLAGTDVVPRMYNNSENRMVTEDGGSFSLDGWAGALNLYWGPFDGKHTTRQYIYLDINGYLNFDGKTLFGLDDNLDIWFNRQPARSIHLKAVRINKDVDTTTTTTTTTSDTTTATTTGDTNTTTTTTSDTNTTSTSWDYCMGIWGDSAHWGSDCQYVDPKTSSTTSYSLYLPTLPTNCDDLSDYLAGYPTELHSLLPSGFCTSVPGNYSVPTDKDTKTESKTVTETVCTEPTCTELASGEGTKIESKTITETVCTEPPCVDVPSGRGTKTQSKTVTETVCTEPTCADVPSDKGTKTESKTVTETVCTEPTCTNAPSEKDTKTGSKTVTETACTEPTCTDVAPKDAAPSKTLANLAALVAIVANVLMT